ncbi:MAG TPA: hypothetical protein VFC67_22950 [Prolixibacteraceae bacterium]|nr:hypothetical protein [Prolixibacteraceae bacterium]
MALIPLTPPRITASPLTNTDIQEQNEAVSKWSSMVQRRLRQSLQQFNNGKNSTVQRPGRAERMLRTSLNSKTKQNYGVIDRVSVQFERHGVFVHKGVGNGYKMQGGTVIRTAKKPIPDPGPRVAVEWFNPILDQTLPELADKLANKLADIGANAVVNATRMMIR